MFESFSGPDNQQAGKSNALSDEFVKAQWKPEKYGEYNEPTFADIASAAEKPHAGAAKHKADKEDKAEKAKPEADEAQPKSSKSIAMALAAQSEYEKESAKPHANKVKVLEGLAMKFQGAVDTADQDARDLSVKLSKELADLTPEKREAAHHLMNVTVTAQHMAMSTVKPEDRAGVLEDIMKAQQGDKAALEDLSKRYPMVEMALKGTEEAAKQYSPVIAKETEMLAQINDAARDEINARLIFAQTMNDAGMDPSGYVKDAETMRNRLLVETVLAQKYMAPRVLDNDELKGEKPSEHKKPGEQEAEDQ